MNTRHGRAALLALVLWMVAQHALAAGPSLTIADIRAQTRDGWRQRYQAHGREIVVDVDIEVPDADAFPALECQWRQGWDIVPMDENYHQIELGGDSLWAMWRTYPELLLYHGKHPIDNEVAGYGTLHPNVTAKPYRVQYPPYAPDACYLPGNDLTFAQIMDVVGANMKRLGIAPDTVDLRWPTEVRTHAYYAEDRRTSLEPGWGSVIWEQQLAGIKVIGQYALSFRNVIDGTGVFPHISALFRTRDFYSLYVCLLDIRNTLADDLPLCGFDTVRKALEEEIRAGRLRHIFDVRLGYGLCDDPAMKRRQGRAFAPERTVYAVPVWVIHALWVRSPGLEVDGLEDTEYGAPDPRNRFCSRMIVIDAQTGALWPKTTQKKDGRFRGFVSWQDVGGKK